MIGSVTIANTANCENTSRMTELTMKSHKIRKLYAMTDSYTHTIYFYYPWYKHMIFERIKRDINNIDFENFIRTMPKTHK